jgi:hypothetical protein
MNYEPLIEKVCKNEIIRFSRTGKPYIVVKSNWDLDGKTCRNRKEIDIRELPQNWWGMRTFFEWKCEYQGFTNLKDLSDVPDYDDEGDCY